MFSSIPPKSQLSSNDSNCTIASTFDKPNSLKCNILFGNSLQRIVQTPVDDKLIDVVKNIFLPNAIFGFSIRSTGKDFKNFHFILVLRSCMPGEVGNVIPAINPGAEILLCAIGNTATSKAMSVFKTLSKNGVNLCELSQYEYRHLNRLIAAKCQTDFFVGEQIALKTKQ